MKLSSLSLVLSFIVLNVVSVYSSEKADSIFIENILKKSSSLVSCKPEERILFFAKALQGKPYASGLLDRSRDEKLVVRTDSFDCTTYVETVIALYLSSKEKGYGYRDFCRSLQKLRYREGIIKGYASRLHYFSDWLSDNTYKGILFETTKESEYSTRVFSLNFMTSNIDLYKSLKSDTSNVIMMRKVETLWKDYHMPYIPKQLLDKGIDVLKIKNGDIVALTTSISGLDVVHMGFAYWLDNKLHLIHASSLRHKVIVDNVTLFDYLSKRKRHTGIRVARLNI